MLLCLCLQVRQEGLIGRESLVVLQVVHHPQEAVEGMDLQTSLEGASPLPAGMNPLTVQDVVRGQEEPRGEELKKSCIFSMVVPQKSCRVCS